MDRFDQLAPSDLEKLVIGCSMLMLDDSDLDKDSHVTVSWIICLHFIMPPLYHWQFTSLCTQDASTI